MSAEATEPDTMSREAEVLSLCSLVQWNLSKLSGRDITKRLDHVSARSHSRPVDNDIHSHCTDLGKISSKNLTSWICSNNTLKL